MLTLEDEKWLQPNVRGGMLVDLAKYTNTVKKKLEVWELVLKKNKKIRKNHLLLVPQISVCGIKQNEWKHLVLSPTCKLQALPLKLSIYFHRTPKK